MINPKEGKGKMKKEHRAEGKRDVCNKTVDLNKNISVITLNISELNFLFFFLLISVHFQIPFPYQLLQSIE